MYFIVFQVSLGLYVMRILLTEIYFLIQAPRTLFHIDGAQMF